MTVRLGVLALVAGALSIASPCVVPLLPAYVSALSGGVSDESRPRATLRAAAGFVAGFTVVFVGLGAVASAVGQLLRDHLTVLTRAGGGVMIAMGVVALWPRRVGVLPASVGARAQALTPRVSPSRTVTLGAAVAVGWTPCIGPVLASVLALAASSTSVYAGVMALTLYSVGLGVPFMAVAVGLDRSGRVRRMVRRWAVGIERVGGALMVLIGVGYATGVWSQLFNGVQGWMARSGWPPL